MPIRISDVAKEAGVSDATVSYVINRSRNVSPQTRRRVEAAVRKLGYKPNVVARSLRVQNTHSIGLVVPNVLNHFFGTIAMTLEKVLVEHGYAVFVCNTLSDVSHEKRLLESLLSRRVDGIVLAPSAEDPEILRTIDDFGIPLVLIDRNVSGIELPTMETNNVDISETAAMHLIEDGHKRIVAVMANREDSTLKSRLSGVQRAVERFSDVECHVLVPEDDGSDDLVRACEQPHTAVFPLNYQAAVRTLSAFQRAHVRPPRDVGFLAFDEGEWMEFSEPPISCIKQPTLEIATEVAKLILRKIEEGDNETVMRRIVSSRLIVRASCSERCRRKWEGAGG